MKFRFVILAAGKGSRMNADVPKAMVLVGGKPILQYLFESIHASGIDGVPVVVVGHERERLCESFQERCDYAVQEEQLGTGHAVQCAKDVVGETDAVIVLYGDHPFVSAKTLHDLADLHERSCTVISMLTTTPVSFEGWQKIFWHWGRVLRDLHGHIMGIREFKDAMESEQQIREVNPSMFCFEAKWLWENIHQLRNDNAKKEFYLTDLVELAVAQRHAIASLPIAPEEAVGVNTLEEREVAEQILLRRV